MEQKEVFQAVLIADNFNTNFEPYESSVTIATFLFLSLSH